MLLLVRESTGLAMISHFPVTCVLCKLACVTCQSCLCKTSRVEQVWESVRFTKKVGKSMGKFEIYTSNIMWKKWNTCLKNQIYTSFLSLSRNPQHCFFRFRTKMKWEAGDVFLPVSNCAVCSRVQKSSSKVVVDCQHFDFLQYDVSLSIVRIIYKIRLYIMCVTDH